MATKLIVVMFYDVGQIITLYTLNLHNAVC